jgi:hypothetical protein
MRLLATRLTSISSAIQKAFAPPSFNPASLFAASEPGVWYDPSDLERYMSQLGPELVTNGDFSNGTTGWSFVGAGMSITDGRLLFNTTTNSHTSQATAAEAGKYYKVTLDVVSYVRGAPRITIGGGSISLIPSPSVLGRKTIYVRAVADGVFRVYGGDFGVGGECVIDNISVRELTAIDTATMFQDAAGTTPVTAVGQPVGLILDKSRGLVLGPELVTNGDFSDGTTGWSAGGAATISASSGRMRVVNNSASLPGSGYQEISTVSGRWYKIEADCYYISGTETTTVQARTSPSPTGGVILGVQDLGVNGSGKASFVFLATGSTSYIHARLSGATISLGATLEFDNISVRELPGNHATQTTSTSRPVLSARYNLLDEEVSSLMMRLG